MLAAHWLWLTLGLLLLVAAPLLGGPLLLVDLTVAAFVTALVVAASPELAWTHQLLVYLGTTLAFLPVCYALAFRLGGQRRGGVVAPGGDYAGAEGVIVGRGQGLGVQLGDQVLPVRSVDGAELRRGDRVRVERVVGITAWVRRLA